MSDLERELFAKAMSRLLKRFADVGWLDSTTVTAGNLSVKYTEKGLERMRLLKEIITKELHVSLEYDEYQALLGLLIILEE